MAFVFFYWVAIFRGKKPNTCKTQCDHSVYLWHLLLDNTLADNIELVKEQGMPTESSQFKYDKD